MKKIVSEDEYFQKWVYGISEGTKYQYLYALAGFCLAISKSPSEILVICKEDYSKPPWERKINDWFIEYDKFCENEKLSKQTFSKRRTNVRGFFRFNHIETPISRRGKRENFIRANDRKLPTKDEIILLLNACNTIKQKAIILTQFSSGLSNSDIIKLTVDQFWNGLDKNDICKIRMRRHKNDNEFVTFISPEAVQAIKSYLRVERGDLDDSQPLFTKFKSSNVPITSYSIVFMYEHLCDGLGWSKEGNAFRKITGHMGRKWLKTNLTNAGMPREPLETLLGHKLNNGTDDNYYLAHEDQLKSIYFKYLPNITINPIETLTLEGPEYQELKEMYENDSKSKEEEIKELKNNFNKIERSMGERNNVLESIIELLMEEDKMTDEFKESFGNKVELLKKHRKDILSH